MTTNRIPHHRPDRERVGWIEEVGEGFAAVDLLGRRRTGVVDWLSAEEALDELGLAYLADPYEIHLDDRSWVRVRIVEVSPHDLTVKEEDGGDINAVQKFHTLPIPVPETMFRPCQE